MKKPENPFKNIKMPKKSLILSIPIVALVLFYLLLPPINWHSFQFWIYFYIIAIYSSLILGPIFKIFKKISIALIAIAILIGALSLSSIEFFNAKRYANIIEKKDGDFKNDIAEIPYNKIPTVDRDTAIRLGSRKMGELLDLVSQFNIDESYTQINYKGNPIRVTPLEYNGLLKWLTNHRAGLPNYLVVDMIDGSARLDKPKENIRYSKSDLFFRDIARHMRFRHPTSIFAEINFEIDEDGTPYWIAATYKPRISWFGAYDVEGAILCNAITGESNYYKLDEIPKWVDRVFSAGQIIKQLEWNGKYQSGYLNSRFAQKGVLQPTAGYNYLAINDDVFLYTGITSVAADQSNVGFVLVNLRTKDTTFYKLSSAEEFSAMASAEGEVQEKSYDATFPLLLNIQDKPTYFLSLKDNAGLIKMYAFVDAQKYQDVSIGYTVEAAYKIHVGEKFIDLDEDINQEDIKEEKGKIADIHNVVIGGNTHYYFILENKDKIFMTNIELSDMLPFMKKGSEISFKYIDKNDKSAEVVEIIK
ncbi:MAG: hypothetical protein Q4P34_07335 [Tissierellia bacterium]|nr:hypothetical protein [Tissierellia bacterium]